MRLPVHAEARRHVQRHARLGRHYVGVQDSSRKDRSQSSRSSRITLNIADLLPSIRSQVPPFELSVNVLTSTFWPGQAIPAGTIVPPLLKEAQDKFATFYLSRHSGRRLTWQPNQGTADVKAKFKTRSHELNVSTYAMIVLLLFDDLEEAEELEYEVSLPPSL